MATLLFGAARDYEPQATTAATIFTRGTHPILLYPDASDTDGVFGFGMPRAYAAAGVDVELHIAMSSATTGTVNWDVSFERVTNLDTPSFASVQSVGNTTVPGTAGDVQILSVSFTDGAQIDNIVAGDSCRIKLTRHTAGATATGDAELLRFEIKDS